MERRHVAVAVVVEPLLHEVGHWCRSCLLPSGISMWVAVRLQDRMHLQLRAWCDHCGGTAITLNGRDDDRPA